MSILIIFIAIVVALQIGLFCKTWKLIDKLKRVLAGNFSTLYLEDAYTVIRYSYPGKEGKTLGKDTVTENIEKSINTYLMKNRGAVSDFALIKDIVERNCDTLEAEVSSQTPLPLYLGLMGTVLGIIVGLITITVNGGFSNIENVIEILMTDVAIAMIASFLGIGLTTWTLWNSKRCKVTVEDNKNRFYTWIQTNLLPVISKSAVSAITLLQKNLTRFNETFSVTVERLEEKMGDVGDVYDSQLEILKRIEAIDVNRMAMANVKILKALDGSMGSLDHFSQYLGSVTEYLNAVRDLNAKLDEHLERTETLSVVSNFYKKQMGEIELRQDAIRQAVVGVDDVMRSALASLQNNSEQGLKALQEAFVTQMTSMQEMISTQTKQLASQMNQLPEIVEKLKEISAIPSKLDKLINRIEGSNDKLVKHVTQTVKSSKDTGLIVPSGGAGVHSTEGKMNPFFKWAVVAVLAVLALVSIANLSVNIISMETLKNSQQKYEEWDDEMIELSNERSVSSVSPQTDKSPTDEGVIKGTGQVAPSTPNDVASSSDSTKVNKKMSPASSVRSNRQKPSNYNR